MSKTLHKFSSTGNYSFISGEQHEVDICLKARPQEHGEVWVSCKK